MATALLVPAGPQPVAQTLGSQRALLMPPVAAPSDSLIARQYQIILAETLVLPPGITLVRPSSDSEQLVQQSLTAVLSNTESMAEFSSRSETDFLISSVISREAGDALEVCVLIYSRKDDQVVSCEAYRFEDEMQLRQDVPLLARNLARRSNFTPSDTAFFYSMFIPGLGQLNRREPVHAAVSFILVSGAAFYGLSTPDPDPFEFSRVNYQTSTDPLTGDLRFYIESTEVSREAFFERVDEDLKHGFQARGERSAAQVRRKRALGLFAAAYLFNLADTLWLSRKKLDTSPFFTRIEPIEAAGSISPRLSMGFRIRLPFG
jgi:hypothetical protein